MSVWFSEVSAAAASFLETTDDYDQLLATITRSCSEALHSTCMVSLIDDTARTVTPVSIYDEDPDVMAAFRSLHQAIPFEQTLLRDMDDSDLVFVPSASLEGASPTMRRFVTEVGMTGYVIVVMRVRAKRIGILSVLRRRTDLPPLDETSRDIAVHLARFAGLAIANAREFHRAEHAEELRRSEARLLELSQFLDAVLDELPAAVFIKDAKDFSFVRINRASQALMGLTPGAAIGKTIAAFVDPELAKISFDSDRRVVESGTLLDQPENMIHTANGPRWLHTRKVPIRDRAGVARWLLGVTHDITELHDALAVLRRANQQTEAANRELEAFSYSVAHDLRTPLRSIDAFSVALMEDCADQLDATAKDYLQRVRTGVQRMGTLIDDLLKFSQVARAEIRKSKVDLGEAFRSALATHQRLEPDRRVEIVVEGDLRTDGDPQLLSIVLANLCGNAWKFTAKQLEARIEMGSRVEEGERVFYVRDNGVGFDMQYATKLFGVFQRLHPSSEFPGTGVGLATVARIVARHGGRVWANATVGAGATFSFTLNA